MLNIRQVKHLARHLGIDVQRLENVAANATSFCAELIVLDPAKPNKLREVLCVSGELRRLQARLYRTVLMTRLPVSPFSHGGIPGRSIKTNAWRHAQSQFALTADISNFYPSIDSARVYRLFTEQLGCSPDVARLITRLCTHKHHLALGLVTSPRIADFLMGPIDRRIGVACQMAGLTYSRYVDDVTISGPFNLRKSGFRQLVGRILSEHGFESNDSKTHVGRLTDSFTITKLRVINGSLDVRREYIRELLCRLDCLRSLGEGGPFEGLYYTRGQIAGRVNFVCWVNPARKSGLLARLRLIKWEKVEREAWKRGIVQAKKRLVVREDLEANLPVTSTKHASQPILS